MVVEILLKNNNIVRFSNVTAVSNISSKSSNDMLVIKRKYIGDEWIRTGIYIKDCSCIQVKE